MTATDRRWRNSGGHGRLIDVEEAYYVCRNASGCVGEGPWSGGCSNESSTRGAQRRARGHVELLQLKAHEREAPREGLGGTDGALSWDRGERARAAHVAARVRRDRTLLCEAPPATAAGNGDGVSSARELECQVLARHRHRPHR